MRTSLVLLCLLLVFGAAPGIARDTTQAIVGAVVVPVSSAPVDPGTVVISGGKILAAGPREKVKVPPGAEVIDGRGKWVIPGLVDPASTAGLAGQRPSGGNTPQRDPLAGLDPRSDDLHEALRAGYTTLVLTREAGGVPGVGVAIRPQGETVAALTVSGPAHLCMTGGTGTQTIQSLRSVLAAAKKELDAKAKYEKDLEAFKKALADFEKKVAEAEKKKEKPPERPKELKEPAAPRMNDSLEAVRQAILGKIPVLARLGSALDVLRFGDVTEGFDDLKVVVLFGGGDGDRIVTTVKERGWSVVLPPTLSTLPYTRTLVNVPAEFHRAGVSFSFTAPRDPADIFLSLALLVRAGLPREAALAAVTREPARQSGLGDRLGTLEKGRDANLVVLDGSPFEVGTRILRVVIRGKTAWPEEEQ